ncbi:serine hydrolase domain-containing protein [Evansella cellulosilytica]|uniref:Beta-lactamase n=1 Tax=Evansella cellulosilytica (strain ATCC 21833 / DSM 2522 / FERM P-1141 / JCM 9156 / N-4) TaxID=649639 RepID=E6U0V1_EVAC2|nr:serine hydrolase [Evansella cellulosilytica]ADU30263.1 beta-lactamase [Evansella cellulosilytica DSM 2522]
MLKSSKGKTIVFLLMISLVGAIVYQFLTRPNYIAVSNWEVHESIDEVGWSAEKLNRAREYFDSLDSTAAMAIYDGKILFSWGDVTKNTNAHSVRKSFLSSLYGIQVEEDLINLQHTLDELNISDEPPLAENEKLATIEHLLTSSSGVFHKAGEESWSMRRNRPSRGSHEPGTHFYYNNWDFNVLGTIYNDETDSDLFHHFQNKIAEPIGMEDFSLYETEYKNEESRSIHPSYLFQISARDMARFGLLYLQEGYWGEDQIIPQNWVKESTSVQMEVPNNEVYDYGYMWWVATDGPFKELGLYSAVGRYGQSIDIVPEENLVFVHRVDSNRRTLSFLQGNVSQKERLHLLSLILAAKE